MGGGVASRARVVPLGALAALIALAGVGVLVAQPSTAASPAILRVVERSVEVQAEGRGQFSAARSGDSVIEGSVIRTDRTGVAAVAYEDGSLTRIGPATTYELVTLRTAEGRREIIGKLDTGQTFHRVSKVTGSGSRFEVRTSDAVAAVRGTAFAVQCLVLDICEFGVTEGTVTVRADDGRVVDVTAGHRVTVDGDGRLGQLKLLSETDPWIARHMAETGPAASDEPDPADEGAPTASSSEPGGDTRFRSWGGFPAATSSSDSEAAAAEPASENSTAGDEEGSRTEDDATTTTASDESSGTASARETTSTTSEPTTTTSQAPATTTTGPAERTTTSTTSAGESRTTSTTSAGEGTTTTTTGGGQGTTTTTTRPGGDTTTSTTSGGGTTTTTSGGTPTTPTSEQSTTTTAPCPEGEEHVEGRGCMPECPHDRPRDPNGNCRRECAPDDQGEECRSAARESSASSESKEALPFLWIFSFLFGGTAFALRAPDRWED